jgi:hypothetical protein
MPKTRINCPNCRQPIMADVEQLFDVSQDPAAKQKLLSGAFNIARCPNCGFEGNLATPIIYHDADKELLLTFFPPDVKMTRDEQERMIGPLINKVVNNLPQEKRKGYLFSPQTVLTMQGLVERILEGEGITRDMVQAQQQRLNLVQRLMNASPETLAEIAREEDEQMDKDFFSLLTRLIETSAMQGDRQSAQRLSDLQKELMPLTTAGKELQEQSKEVEAAIRSLQEAGRSLTREKLLDLVIEAPNETRLSVLASLARPGMDYSFFQMLSERIENAGGEEKERLTKIRDTLLEITREVDQQMEARMAQSKELLNAILQEADIVSATQQSLPAVDDFFMQTLNSEMAEARQIGNLDRIEKLQKVVSVLQEASASPPEISLIEELLEVPDEPGRRKWLEEHREEISPEFMDTLTSLVAQSQAGEDPELTAQLQKVYRSVLKFSMEANLNK